MRRKIQFPLLILTMVLLAGTACVPQTEKSEMGIEFKEEEYDFGVADEGDNLEHDFLFINTGSKALKILDITSSCKCTVADNWDKIVKPAGIGKIRVTLKTSGLEGDVSQMIKVKTDVRDRENITLTVKGNVKTLIAITPRNAFLGEVLPPYNKPFSGRFEIENSLGAPLKILQISAPDERTEFKLITLKENMKYRVDFTVSPPFAGEEMIKKEFRIKTDNKDRPEVRAAFSYFIPPPLNVWPTTVNIDLDQLKDYVIPFVTAINIKSTMDKPIRIQDLKLTGGKGIKYDILEATRGLVYQILIEVPLDYKYRKDEKVYFTFKVRNDPKNIQYNVPVKFSKTENSN